MIQFVIAGLALGGIYALSAAGIVMTYVSTGVLNFAYASIAYFVARLYYFLLVQHHWSIGMAALASIGVCGPVMGVILYLVLFRFLRQSTTLVKIVATIGLSVSIPPIATTLFKNISILGSPGLSPLPVHTYRVADVAINANQLIAYGAVLAVLLAGTAVLRFTDAGLRVRAVVDSEAMTSLSGTNPSAVALTVWAVSTFLAGLIGVLAAPIISLDPITFQLLVAAAFAAVVAARLRSLGVAVAIGLAIGIAGSLAQWALPATSNLVQVVVPSIPFAFIVLFLGYSLIRHGSVTESTRLGGVLDRAIQVDGGNSPAPRTGTADSTGTMRTTVAGALCGIALIAALPFVLPKFWGGLFGQLMAIAVIFLSLVLVVGEGGMIWLCQITLAGVGALTTAQLATNHGWPVIGAVVAGGLLASSIGAVIAIVTIRLGDLYVALVTFTFALLMSTLVFTREVFFQNGLGVNVSYPSFAASPIRLAELGVVAFSVLACFVFSLRRGTTGLALSAIRSSPTGARSIGLSVVKMKVLVSVLASFIAGIGGGLLAIYSQAALPDTFDVFTGLVWLAVLVPFGIRSNAAALVAAAFYTYVPAIFVTYLPVSWARLPIALFGVGAVVVARHPHGALEMQAQRLRGLVHKTRPRASAGHRAGSGSEIPDFTVASATDPALSGSTSSGRRQ